MSNTAIIEKAAAGSAAPDLPVADWDLLSFITNAKDYGQLIGGAIVTLIGLIILIVAVVFIAKKFLGNGQRDDKSWLIIVVMLLVGGAFITGGITFIMNISSGGQKTVEDLGTGGFIMLQSSLGLLR